MRTNSHCEINVHVDICFSFFSHFFLKFFFFSFTKVSTNLRIIIICIRKLRKKE